MPASLDGIVELLRMGSCVSVSILPLLLEEGCETTPFLDTEIFVPKMSVVFRWCERSTGSPCMNARGRPVIRTDDSLSAGSEIALNRW